MIQWFKSIWMRMRKSNGLPGNTVLIPLQEQKVSQANKISLEGLPKGTNITITPPEQKPKRKYTRKIKDVTN